MLKFQVIPGMILVVFGLIHILSPARIRSLIKAVYANSFFVRNGKDLEARSGFISLFGLIWILAGLFVLFFA